MTGRRAQFEQGPLDVGGSKVTRLSLGCEQLGGTDWGQADERSAIAALECGLEAGISSFDTAAVYGLGRSESTLGRVLAEHRGEVFVATKVGYAWEGGDGTRARTSLDGNPASLQRQILASLARLRRDVVPLCYLHRPDPAVAIERSIEALGAARDAGRIGAIGCSNVTLAELQRALTVAPIAAVQVSYSLLDATHHGLIDYCRASGVAVFTYGALGQGLLTGKYTVESRFAASDRRHRLATFQGAELTQNLVIAARVAHVAAKYQRSSAQCAVRWVLDNPGITSAIVGVKSPSQVTDILGALGWELEPVDHEFLGRADGR